jgi:chromate reductase
MSVPTGGQESCSTDDDRTGRQKVNDDHYKIGYFVGSLSSTCIKRVLSEALIRLAPEDLEFTEIPIGNLPLYSPDYDANYSPEPPR